MRWNVGWFALALCLFVPTVVKAADNEVLWKNGFPKYENNQIVGEGTYTTADGWSVSKGHFIVYKAGGGQGSYTVGSRNAGNWDGACTLPQGASMVIAVLKFDGPDSATKDYTTMPKPVTVPAPE